MPFPIKLHMPSRIERCGIRRAPSGRTGDSSKYITAGVIGAAKRVDAQHIAMATVHRVDVLVSWNFKHIVNLDRIQGYNSVNLRSGYPLLEIRTPQEVLSYGED